MASAPSGCAGPDFQLCMSQQTAINAMFDRLRAEPPTTLRLSAASEPSLSSALLPSELCVAEQALTGRKPVSSSAVCSMKSCMVQLFQTCGLSGGGLTFAHRPALWSRHDAVAPSSLAESHLAAVADKHKQKKN